MDQVKMAEPTEASVAADDRAEPGRGMQAPSGTPEQSARNERWTRRRRAGRRALEQGLRGLGERVRNLDDRLVEMNKAIENLRWWLQQTSDRGDRVAGAVHHLSTVLGSDLPELRRLVAADVPLHHRGGLELETFDADRVGRVVGFRDGGPDEAERLYVRFEDYFRGSESEIRERQRPYITLLEERRRVLDVGCGRGELLEAMRDAGIDASGVDSDPAMVQHCRDKGLEVHQGDAVARITGLPAHSLGAVIAVQLIEHLSYVDLVGFLRTSQSRLEPGGLLIVETVNPHAPQALKHFWIDPTHRNPLFPETVLALCRLTGFAAGYIWHPHGTGDPDTDRAEQPDYAVVATTPTR